MAQKDMKKLVAYSSVSHLGFVMLGLFALNPAGLKGGVLQMINHGLSTGALFLLVGIIYERRHTRMISEYGGLSAQMPVYATIFLIITMSSIGLPSLNGFVGEFTILVGAFHRNPWWAVAAAIGIVLGAAYMLWMYQRVFFGPFVEPREQGLQRSRRARARLPGAAGRAVLLDRPLPAAVLPGDGGQSVAYVAAKVDVRYAAPAAGDARAERRAGVAVDAHRGVPVARAGDRARHGGPPVARLRHRSARAPARASRRPSRCSAWGWRSAWCCGSRADRARRRGRSSAAVSCSTASPTSGRCWCSRRPRSPCCSRCATWRRPVTAPGSTSHCFSSPPPA